MAENLCRNTNVAYLHNAKGKHQISLISHSHITTLIFTTNIYARIEEGEKMATYMLKTLKILKSISFNANI